MLFSYSAELWEVPDLSGIEISKTVKQVYCPSENEILWEAVLGVF